MKLRWATPDDLPALIQFGLGLARETEDIDLDPAALGRGIGAALDDPDRARHLVAEDASGTLLGSLMLTREWGDWYGAWYWWIQSVYVAPDARGQGVFARLYAEVQTRARDAGVRALRLYVDQDNDAALETYRRMGMRQSRYLMFEQRLDAPVNQAPGETSD